jgi:hypothetical protein
MRTGFFQEWRVADQAASAAEKLLLVDSLNAIEQGGVAPTLAAIAHAARLRAVANDLYAVAMELMKARAESLKRH